MRLLDKGRVNLFTILFILSISSISSAAVFNVSDSDGLRVALNAARSNGEEDTIVLAAGTYAVGRRGQFLYDPRENFPLNLQGPSSGPLAVIDGQGFDRGLLINTQPLLDDSNAHVRMSHLQFSNGRTSGVLGGGGLRVQTNDADVSIFYSIFEHNSIDTVSGDGGGLSVETGYQGNIQLKNCSVFDNFVSVSASGIGAMLIAGRQVGGVGGIEVTNSFFDNNTSGANLTAGGGLYAQSKTDLTMINNIFSNNSLGGPDTNGGGAYLLLSGPGARAHLIHNTVFNNVAGFQGGGIILAFNASAVNGTGNIYNNLFFQNTAFHTDDLFIGMSSHPSGTALNVLHNNFFNYDQECTAPNCTLRTGNNSSVDPQFVDGPGGDLRLADSSTIRDSGDPAAPRLPVLDFAGNQRILGSAPDLGALEANPVPPPAPPAPPAPTGPATGPAAGSPPAVLADPVDPAAPGSGGGCSMAGAATSGAALWGFGVVLVGLGVMGRRRP